MAEFRNEALVYPSGRASGPDIWLITHPEQNFVVLMKEDQHNIQEPAPFPGGPAAACEGLEASREPVEMDR